MSEAITTTADGTSDGTTRGTFPQLLRQLAVTRPDDIALQEKRYGIWQPITWAEYERRVASVAHAFDLAGIGPGDVVAVLGDNRPEWLLAELAAQSIGAAVVGIYPTSVGEELTHVLTYAEVRFVVAEDQEQVDKLLGIAGDVPSLERIVYYDPHGLETYHAPVLTDFADLERQGAADAACRPDWFAQQVEARSPDDIAVICTTSGTTSRPKLATLTHRNLLAMGRQLMELDPVGPADRYVSFLPFAWIGEQMLTLAVGLQVGQTISFPEDAETTKVDLREIGPNVMFSPPRIWESMLSDVQVRLGEAGWLKRSLFGWGYRVGDRVADKRVRGESVGPTDRTRYAIAEAVALRPIREQLGLRRLDRGYTGGAPLGPDVFRFFHAIGVNLKQIYGQTEICGIAVVHSDDDVKFNTVGKPIPGTDLRIADDGEIQLRSAAIFGGYLHNDEATTGALADDGWLRTGDAGYLDDDGHLVVIDRAKDVLHTSEGTMFSPAFIENKVKFSPFVEEAVVFGGTGDGDAGEDITALITLDANTVGNWAENEKLSYTTYTDLAAKSEVGVLIGEETARANVDLPEAIRVRRVVLLHKPFDPDDDEITRTRKVRRNVVVDRYDQIIAALGRGDDRVTITSKVTYQDGTSAERELSLAVVTVPG